jgi:CRP-like cAMP-binding protein
MSKENKIPGKEQVLFSFISKYMELTDEEKCALLELSIFKLYKKGSILIREGDITRENYLVIKGCIRTYCIIDGKENVIEFYTELQSYAPPSTIERTPSGLFASCVEESLLLVSTVEIEEEIFRKFPRFERLCRIFSEEMLAKKQGEFEKFRSLNPEQRYLQMLKMRPELVQRVPQYQLASYLGIKPESLSRIRRRLALK